MTATLEKRIDIPCDVEAAGEHAVEFYISMLEKGESPLLAEMLALRQSPRCMTDSVLFEGIGTLDKQFGNDTDSLQRTITNARKHGYNPNVNDFYNSSLANFPGDPKAFVPATGGRGHIQKVCEERGVACSGAVIVKAREPEKDPHDTPKHRLNPRIVKRNIQRMVKENPDLKRVDNRELTAEVIAKHGKQT